MAILLEGGELGEPFLGLAGPGVRRVDQEDLVDDLEGLVVLLLASQCLGLLGEGRDPAGLGLRLLPHQLDLELLGRAGLLGGFGLLEGSASGVDGVDQVANAGVFVAVFHGPEDPLAGLEGVQGAAGGLLGVVVVGVLGRGGEHLAGLLDLLVDFHQGGLAGDLVSLGESAEDAGLAGALLDGHLGGSRPGAG